ncbi:MAG TPA: PfkB family carbohydrate kinase [Elusimicrobiota bacterium]|jgi:sugar/nucleoside kinase (ribokinase family)|nr:PfkB family carbohydrate kinase [Elusimicrobiota bacterium]
MSAGILVVGSVALDSVKTPEGESREALGGSAVYFSLAARHFSPVRMVGVVGEDFPKEFHAMLAKKGIDTAGLKSVPGKTFRWVGKFGKDLNSAKTLATHLNVFETFRPTLSAEQKACPVVLLANIDPELQSEVLSQMKAPRLVACDTMNYWIDSKKPALKELLSRVDVLFINEEEARKLSGESNNVRAAKRLSEWGPRVVVVKKGEHGALLYAGGHVFPFPAFPVEIVKDPTGAGDTFAGGFLGFLAADPDIRDVARLKRALLYGSVLASFNVSDFSTRCLEDLELPAIEERFRRFAELLAVSAHAVPA